MPVKPSGRNIGFSLRRIFLLPRTFGWLAKNFHVLTKWQLRRIVGETPIIVLTYPVQAAVLRSFPDRKIFYYVSDDFSVGYGFHPKEVRTNEAAIAAVAERIITVSRALADRFHNLYGVPLERITVCPNAVPEAAIPDNVPSQSDSNLAPVPSHFYPLAGVAGTISSRLHLGWLHEVVEATPWLYWAFVGPVSKVDKRDLPHLNFLKSNPRCNFTGGVSYERLSQQIRSFDIALIPLNETGINPACSPVRLFSQLPYGQPILVTPGSKQLEEYQPLVRMCNSPSELIVALEEMRECGFNDGLREHRWRAATENTWENRAQRLAQVMKLDKQGFSNRVSD